MANETVQPMRTILLGKLYYAEQSMMRFSLHRRTSPVASALTSDVSVDQFQKRIMLRLTKVNITVISLIFKQPELKVSLFVQLRVNFSFPSTISVKLHEIFTPYS